jgi:hypothetical protein
MAVQALSGTTCDPSSYWRCRNMIYSHIAQREEPKCYERASLLARKPHDISSVSLSSAIYIVFCLLAVYIYINIVLGKQRDLKIITISCSNHFKLLSNKREKTLQPFAVKTNIFKR